MSLPNPVGDGVSAAFDKGVRLYLCANSYLLLPGIFQGQRNLIPVRGRGRRLEGGAMGSLPRIKTGVENLAPSGIEDG
ncbi:unnamed protein product [Camellia sinensis]